MIKTVTYEAVDKSALRKKGWKLFAVILSLQLIFLISLQNMLSYSLFLYSFLLCRMHRTTQKCVPTLVYGTCTFHRGPVRASCFHDFNQM